MTQIAPVTPLADLPALTPDEIDDGCFKAQDLAWAKLVEAFELRREKEGLTYKGLGQRIGRSKSQVQRWLGSAFGMNIRSLGLLAEGLDVDLKIVLQPRREEAEACNFAHPIERAKIRWQFQHWGRGNAYADDHVIRVENDIAKTIPSSGGGISMVVIGPGRMATSGNVSNPALMVARHE